MNRLCGGKSAWEVMEEHEDFAQNKNLPTELNDDQVSVPVFFSLPHLSAFHNANLLKDDPVVHLSVFPL